MADLLKLIGVLDPMTGRELPQLNDLIVERLRMMRNIRAHDAMMTFHLGQRARSTTDVGHVVRATWGIWCGGRSLGTTPRR